MYIHIFTSLHWFFHGKSKQIGVADCKVEIKTTISFCHRFLFISTNLNIFYIVPIPYIRNHSNSRDTEF